MPGDPWLETATWRRVRVFVLNRDGWKCKIGGPKCLGWANEVDHVISRADGGPMFDPRNLRAACKPCNGGRAAKRTNDKYRYRNSVPSYETRL